MVYGDLRFIKNTPEIQEKIDTMVGYRVQMTLQYSIRRSVDDETFQRTFKLFDASGQELAKTISGQTSNQELTM